MQNQIVDEFNDDARTVEAQLEELGKKICDLKNSGISWQHINIALTELRAAINTSHHMYED